MTPYVFNAAARETLDLSRAESVKRNHEYIGTEHLLLGLLASSAPSLTLLTRRLRLDRAWIAARVDAIIQRGKGQVPASMDLPFTSRAKRVLELAIEAAASTGTTDVGAEHLFIGLCAEERGLGGQVLAESGITTDAAKTALKEIAAE
jgi:ATP-dependent Clp protease ATP-binding subunit ClpC